MRFRGGLRWGAFGISIAIALISIVALPLTDPVEAPLARMFAVAFVAAGVVALGKPDGRRIGWLLVGMGFVTLIVDVGSGYAMDALERGWPGALWVQWFVNWFSVTQFVALIALILLYPTGRTQSRRWRGALRLLLVAGAGVTVLAAIEPGEITAMDGRVLGPTPVWTLETPATEVIATALAFLGLGVAIASLAGLVLRYRRAVGVERAQLRWFVYGVSLTLGLVITFMASAGVGMVGGPDIFQAEWLADLLLGLGLLCIPMSIWVAMARYRLYDIDRIISRTVTYAIVLLTIGLLYAVMVVAPVAVVGTGDAPDLLVAAATLAAAALFQPLARRVRGAVDRRFSRARYDAARTLEQLSARLRDQVDDSALRTQVVDAVMSTMQPSSAWIWTTSAQVGEPAS